MSKPENYLIEEILKMLCLPPDGEQTEARPEAPFTQAGMAGALTQFMDEMPGGLLIYRADEEEEILYANRSLLHIFQCETMEEFRELCGNSFRGLVHPDDREQVEKSIQQQIFDQNSDLDYVEYRICRKDGSIRWIEDYGHFAHSKELGDIFYVFLGDATEKREMMLQEKNRLVKERLEKEQKLQNLIEIYDKERSLINQRYLRQLEVIEGLSVNYASICYVDLDSDEILPYRLSDRTAPLLEEDNPRPYSEYYPRYVELWVHPEDREMVMTATSPDYIRERLAHTQTYYFNFRVLMDGELQYIQLRLVNVGRHEGVSQVVMGYRRVDEEMQKQMEQQALLAEALAKANLAVDSKNVFLSNMSHDMRTPLHAIFGFTSLAKLNIRTPDEALDYLDRVETASRQLLDMIEKVLEVSALSGSEAGVEEVECDLRETVQKVYDFLQPQAREKHITFSLNCQGLHHNAVYADQEKLRQMLMYLTNNAVTYTNPGGRVSITITEGEPQANHYTPYRFVVQDSGIGISKEFLEKMFEPFSREKNSTLSGVHGIGLGLTIVKSIVDMMGGTLDVQSIVNAGSTFTVGLSFRTQTSDNNSRNDPEKEYAQRILLVEDNQVNREIEMELLEKLGFFVDSAENGQVALEKIRNASPGDYDLVLMDLQMPVMDGWRASVAIRSLPDERIANIPIIALSASVLESDLKRSKDCGIDAHLLKPMDLSLLMTTIQEITGKNPPA